jgi:hypothetical protein
MERAVGSGIIGMMTTLLGYPVYNGEFNLKNLLICVGAISLWIITTIVIEKNGRS